MNCYKNSIGIFCVYLFSVIVTWEKEPGFNCLLNFLISQISGMSLNYPNIFLSLKKGNLKKWLIYDSLMGVKGI